MRRGLISWSRAELPETVLDARVAATQAGMRQQGIDALAVYTTPARAAGVAWLAGFVPYWNQGLLVVPAEGRPILVSALSNRVADWLQRNAHVAAVRNSPRIGAEAAAFVATSKPKARIGIVDLAALPTPIIAEIEAAGHGVVDATELLAGLRRTADPADIALHARAAMIAARALSCDLGNTGDANEAIARMEETARAEGAEEVYPAVIADLSLNRNFVRIEGGRQLGPAFAVRLSVAYKGAWVRVTRTFDRSDGSAARLRVASETFAAAVATLPDTRRLSACRSWLVEATRTTMPLEARAGAKLADGVAIEPAAIVNVQATIEVDGQAVWIGGPVLTGGHSGASSLLVAPPV